MTDIKITDLHKKAANALRALSMDAVQKAKSGHPGMPMGMADVMTVLYTEFLRFDARDALWQNRDRFVLSAGHGSMLLYAALHLGGSPDITLEEIRNFRQKGAKTAGHPEYGYAGGIETTTGPLGQGIANAVGMALSEAMLRTRVGEDSCSHYTYAIAGDGCLMEGISQEAISLAGHLGLGRLIVLFDDNGISIDGATDLTVSEDTRARFEACGWDWQAIDGHDMQTVADAIARAQKTDTPSIIACKTVIGYGAPNKAGTSGAHGAPLGEGEIIAAKQAIGWEHAPFEVPREIYDFWQGRVDARMSQKQGGTWGAKLPADVLRSLISDMKKGYAQNPASEATRKSSAKLLDALTPELDCLIGGSADLTGSNLTKTGALTPVQKNDYSGRYIYYGVREHAMAAVMNGIALHGAFVPYGGTFFVFTDYCRPAVRLSALMEQQVIYVMTHDSIGLGEDGPTHQPVEHLASLRAMPGLQLMRPADGVETAECWELALQKEDAPSMLVLSRQGTRPIRTQHVEENLCARGAYEVAGGGGAQVTLIATGAEVGLAMEAREALAESGITARVVSMPCSGLFDAQNADYKRDILAPDTLRVGIEAASSFGWERYIGEDGLFFGIEGFGASAPADELFAHYGLEAQNIVSRIKERLAVKNIAKTSSQSR